MYRIFRHLTQLNLATLRFNFRYFPFRQAIRFPVLVSRNVLFEDLSGKVVLEGDLYFGKIRIGYGEIGIFDRKYSRSIWQVGGTVIFRGSASLGHGTRISVGEDGILTLGANFAVSAESTIVCHRKITFGDNCLLSWENLIMDTDMHPIRDHENRVINHPEEVVIGDSTWIGCRTTILKGSVIPPQSIIGAGALITKPLEGTRAVFGSAPARKLRENVSWKM